MTMVPPGARSLKAKTAILAIQKANQSAEHVGGGNMNFSNSVALSKVDGYVSESFTKSDVQVLMYILILCSLVGLNHFLTKEYRTSRDYLEENKIQF